MGGSPLTPSSGGVAGDGFYGAATRGYGGVSDCAVGRRCVCTRWGGWVRGWLRARPSCGAGCSGGGLGGGSGGGLVGFGGLGGGPDWRGVCQGSFVCLRRPL